MKIALCVIGRRENRYAREFVDHYLGLGFDHILVCDNNHRKEEHFEDVLQPYIDKGKVSVHNFRDQQGAQCAAYNTIYRKFGGRFDWIAFFDFDEFLVVNKGNIKQLLEKQDKHTEAVLVNWMCYGDCGLVNDDGRGVMERFTTPLPYDKHVQYDFPNNNHIKSIVRGRLPLVKFAATPHIPDTIKRAATIAGKACKPGPFQDYDFSVAHLKHFATKTIAEWMQNKWEKGTANKPNLAAFRRKYADRFFRYNETTPEKLKYIERYKLNHSDRITVIIVHYNTPKLTACAIRSLQKQSPGVGVIVFDNSDKKPFQPMNGVEIIDNTKGQVINFDKFLAQYPDKVDVGNGWASAKHCFTVQWLINKRSNPFILMDSDVLVKKDVTSLWDKRKAFVGEVKPHNSQWGVTVDRVLPFLCFINVGMIKRNGVTYFNFPNMWALTPKKPACAFDTGCWFLADVNAHNLPYHVRSIDPYILHLGHASWRDKDAGTWLKQNRALWQ